MDDCCRLEALALDSIEEIMPHRMGLLNGGSLGQELWLQVGPVVVDQSLPLRMKQDAAGTPLEGKR